MKLTEKQLTRTDIKFKAAYQLPAGKGGSGAIDTDWLVSISERWKAICAILDGKEVDEFYLACPEVRQVKELVEYNVRQALEGKTVSKPCRPCSGPGRDLAKEEL